MSQPEPTNAISNFDRTICCNHGLGLSLLLAGDYTAAEVLLQRVVKALEKTRMNPAQFVSSLNNLAALRRVQGRYAESERLLRQGMMIAKEAIAPDDPALVTITESLAVILKTEGNTRRLSRFTEAWPKLTIECQGAIALTQLTASSTWANCSSRRRTTPPQSVLPPRFGNR